MKRVLLIIFLSSFHITANEIYNPLINLENAKLSANLKEFILDKGFDNSLSNDLYCQNEVNHVTGTKLLNLNHWNEAVKKVGVLYSYANASYDYVRDNPDIVFLSARAVNMDTKEEVFVSNFLINSVPQANCSRTLVRNICNAVTGSTCFMTNFMDSDDTDIFEEYWSEKQTRLSAIEQKRISEFMRLESKCIKLGFEGADNIRICIQREAQIELELQEMEYLLAQRQNSVVETESGNSCFLCDVLIGVIKEYPAAKAQADRENAIRRNAYIRGQNNARAVCRSSISC